MTAASGTAPAGPERLPVSRTARDGSADDASTEGAIPARAKASTTEAIAAFGTSRRRRCRRPWARSRRSTTQLQNTESAGNGVSRSISQRNAVSRPRSAASGRVTSCSSTNRGGSSRRMLPRPTPPSASRSRPRPAWSTAKRPSATSPRRRRRAASSIGGWPGQGSASASRTASPVSWAGRVRRSRAGSRKRSCRAHHSRNTQIIDRPNRVGAAEAIAAAGTSYPFLCANGVFGAQREISAGSGVCRWTSWNARSCELSCLPRC